MIHPTEQQVIDTLNDRLEELKKTVKSYSKYSQETQSEYEAHYKKIGNISKSFISQVIIQKEDTLQISTNIQELLGLFDFISKTKVTQLSDFNAFLTLAIESYNDKMNGFTKKITDQNYTNVKALSAARSNYKKAKEKYEKLLKEIDANLNSSKKTANDATTGYNVGLTQKNDQKLKELVKQVEQAEQQYKELSEQCQLKTNELDQGIIESAKYLHEVFNHLYQSFVTSQEKVIEITMKQDQHRLLASNYIKGYVEEKLVKITSFQKLDPNVEDQICSQKYENDHSQIKYLDVIEKLISQKNLLDIEYLMFPDILHKHMDCQLQLISDRMKNLKLISTFFTEIGQQFESIHVKLLRNIKTQLAYLQERNSKEKFQFAKQIYLVQELITQYYDQYCKRFQTMSQGFLQKAAALDNLIKDQKTNEKSFLNMYQKMLKDFQQSKQMVLDNESKPQVKEANLQVLRKTIKEGAIILKFSLDQVRQSENQRVTSIMAFIEQSLKAYQAFVEENIVATKTQEEILNVKFDQVQKEEPYPINTKSEHIETKFTKVFVLTEEIKQRIEEAAVITQDEEVDDKNLEEGSVKVSQKLLEQFKVQEGEKCLASYACAFDNTILLQGRLYLFSSRVCFHSYFNNKTLFGTTVLLIPANEIQQVKKVKAYLVDAAIELKTQKGLIVFASLVNRDHTVNQLKLVKGLADKVVDDGQEIESQKVITVSPFKTEEIVQAPQQQSVSDTNSKQQVATTENTSPKQQDTQKLLKQQIDEVQIQPSQTQTKTDIQQPATIQQTVKQESPPQPLKISQTAPETISQEQTNIKENIMIKNKQQRYMNQPNVVKFTQEFAISVQRFTELFLLDRTDLQEYQSFGHQFQVSFQKDNITSYNKYTNPQWGEQANRQVLYIHPVREKQMFAPDTVTCTQNDILYLFSKQEVLHEREIQFAKIPYADNFVCRVYHYLTETPTGCKLEYGFLVHFLKSCMFKGKIESSSKSENTDVWEKGLKLAYIGEVSKLESQLIQKQPQEPEIIKPVVKQQVEVLQQDVTSAQDNSLYEQIMIRDKQKRYMHVGNVVRFQDEYKIGVQDFCQNIIFDKQYSNFQSLFHKIQVEVQKDRDIVFNLYEPVPSIGNISKRTMKFIHPIEKQMMAPDSVECTANEIIYYFNKDEVLVEKEVLFAKIPYADCFSCRTFHHVKATEVGCKLEYGFYIHFMKSCMFKGKIESNSKKENTILWEQTLKSIYAKTITTLIDNNKQALLQTQNEKPIVQDAPKQVEVMQRVSEPEIQANVLSAQITQPIQIQPSLQQGQLQQLTTYVQLLILLVTINILITLWK